jgi:hypothetical protein
MSRVILVSPESPALCHASTRVLNQYPNRAILIETDAPAPEADVAVDEQQVPLGLQLDAQAAALSSARLRFGDGSRAQTPDSAFAAETEKAIPAYVEFIGQIDHRWLDQLRQLDIRVLTYQPENSYLAYGTVSAFRQAQTDVRTTGGQAAIRSVTELTTDLKHKLPLVNEDGEMVTIVVIGAPNERADIAAQVAAVPGVDVSDAGNDVLDANRLRLRARVRDGGAQAALLRLPRVLSIEAYRSPQPEDEVAGLIIAGRYGSDKRPSGSYLNWLGEHGIDGRGVTIGIVDGGVNVAHPALAGRARDLAGGQKDWHATMVAGHAAGNYQAEVDANRFIYGLGTAPAATILSQDKMQDASFVCRQTVREAGAAGAVQNNSWGKDNHNPMDYCSEEALYDALVRNADPQGPQALPLTICFSSGNSGERGLTRPKGAKNLIVTGNSENFRPDAGHDGSNDIDEVYSGAHGSSYGNCGDGRIRPHVVAPGEWTASANYGCQPGEDEYISPNLTWGGGSSGASPKTAGACALLIDWWRRANAGNSPSPAMLRALIVNGAEPIRTGGAIPNQRQGWGRLNTQNILDATVSRILVDQRHLLSHPNDLREWYVRAADPARAVKITLAWTDPPGAIGSGGTPAASPVVNKLALRAEVGNYMYRAVQDRFDNGFSVPDDAFAGKGRDGTLAEGSDNLQNIFLPPGLVGAIRISVTALNVTTDCMGGTGNTLQQDFALVISNARLDAAALPADIAVAVDAGAGGPAPAAADGYWAEPAAQPDRQLLGAAPALPQQDGAAHTRSEDNTMPAAAAAAHEDDAWWADTDAFAWPETTRTAAPVTADPRLGTALDAGVSLLTAAGHGAQPAAPGARGEASGRAAATDLGAAIAHLQAQLEHAPSAAAVPRLCPVLVVGAGTRLRVADVHALRALGGAGPLFIVSDVPDLLVFLAQRIGHQPNIHYRLARDRAELPDLVLDTMAEAGGLQAVMLAGPTTATASGAGGVKSTYRFGVVADDRAIVLHCRTTATGGASQVRLVRPGAADVVWTPGAAVRVADAGLSVLFQDGLLQIHDGAANSHAGTWTVEITAAAPQSLSVKAWALGGPWISVSQAKGWPVAQAGEADEQRVLNLSADAGVNFMQASIPAPRVAAPGAIAAELTRSVVVQARRGRLDSAGQRVSEDGRQPLPVARLRQSLQLPGPSASAAVLDVPIDLLGIDASGYHFARRVRTNLLRLRSLAAWRADLSADAALFYTRGQIAELRLQQGVVTALRLVRGAATRIVSVRSQVLALQLARLDAGHVRGRTFIFGVRGSELLRVFTAVEHVPALGTDHQSVTEPVGQTPAEDWANLLAKLISGAGEPLGRDHSK